MNKKINFHSLPVYRDAGFVLKDINTTKKAFAQEHEHYRSPDQYIYSRYRNPTVVAAEEQIMELENCKWSLLTQSGMAAIDLALSIFQESENTDTWLFFSEIYGGTNSYIDLVLKRRRGIKIEHFNATNGNYNLTELENVLDTVKPKLIYFEAVSNPMLIVADVKNIIKIAKKRNILVIIDNTFATPYLWKPLGDGADLVIHSVTKYFAGHGNLSGGVVCGNNRIFEQAALEYRKWIGHMMSPDDAARLSDYLKTFELRFQQHCDNALRLATFLEKHPKIENVLYPGLKSHPTHNFAEKIFGKTGFGGMITFDLAGKDNEEKELRCNRFIDLLSESIPLVPTLGDADTILMPVAAVWGAKYPFPGMIRLSVGIEPYKKIESKIRSALNLL